MVDPDLDTRARILDAAEKAFADGGLAGARVASIAEAAGANKAMLYYYFDSKEALYFAVLERVFEQIAEVAATVGLEPQRPTDEAVRTFIIGYQGVLAAHPDFVRLALRGLLDHPQAIIDFIKPRMQTYLPLVMARIASAQRDGRLNPAVVPMLTPPTLIAPILLFQFASLILADITGLPVDGLRERFRENALEIYLNGLLPREDR